MKQFKFHLACLLFPKLGEQELQGLVDDIKQNGLQNPIVLLDGKVLDGRNRLAACEIAGVEPTFLEWSGDGSPLEWVISQNLIRRHLTSSQRAVVAFDLLPMLEKEAKERQRLSKGRGIKVANKLATFSGNGKASQLAVRIAKTNSTYVELVKTIHQQAPELLTEIRSGSLKLPEAKEVAKLPARQRKKVLGLARRANPRMKLAKIIRQVELDALQRSNLRRVASAGTNGPVAARNGKSAAPLLTTTHLQSSH